jgi:hypothetical protein
MTFMALVALEKVNGVTMNLTSRRYRLRVGIVFRFVLAGIVPVAWAGPYLLVTEEPSSAVSKSECVDRVVEALSLLQKQGLLKVDGTNNHLGVTNDSTLNVDCVFIGKDKQGSQRWMFYTAIASTNEQESKDLMDRARWQLTHLPPKNTL